MTFEEINSEPKIILRFTASWCGPCKALAPIFDEVASKSTIKTLVVDVDQNPELAQAFNIRGIPTVLKIENGNVTDKFSGAQPRPEVEKLFV